jgi:beta-lactamase regulating signal transducer with metallopeptidase domain
MISSLEHIWPWLFSVIAKTSALLLINLAATQLLRRRSASLRHFLHSLTMVCVLLLPFASGLLPELRLAVLPRSAEQAPSLVRENIVAAPEYSPSQPIVPVTPKSGRTPAVARHTLAVPAPERGESTTAVSAAASTLPKVSALKWQEVLILLWIIGTAVCLTRLAVTQLSLRRLVKRAQPVRSITLASRLRWLCRDMGIRREVELLVSSELDVPIAAGVFNPKIILCPQSGEWSEPRRNAVLCHELAHIKRCDGFTQLLANIAAAIYWFNPAVWLTVRAMRYERERACDDYVLSFGTPASDYAHELLEIVSTLRRPQPAAALAMARRSQLEGRVLALLNPRVPHKALPARTAVVLSFAVMAIALPVAAAKLQERPASPPSASSTPQPVASPTAKVAPLADTSDDEEAVPAPAPPAPPAEPAIAPAEPQEPVSAAGAPGNFEYHNSTQSATSSQVFGCFANTGVLHSNVSSHTDDNGYRTFSASWSGGNCNIEAQSSGEVRFNAEATAVESIAPGGHFEINERIGDNLRRLRVEPGANGQLSFNYKVNGAQKDFDADARAWFSSFLLELERATGFSASTRVPALLAKGGPQAVLTEIEQLKSDYVRQVYFSKLFESATLPGPMLVKALDEARNSISTDYSLAQVLLTIAHHYDLNDEAQRTAFLNATSKLKTDYEHSRVLIELLKRPNLSPQILRSALESAKSIGTDYEKGRILTTLAGLSTFDESEISTYLDLASAIGTDYEHSRVLLALMEHQKLGPQATSKILNSASSIGTDYEKSRILLAVSQSHNFDEKQIATYLTLVDSIGTDYERSRDLISLMQEHKLAGDSVGRIIAETVKIGTDYEKARVLTEAAHRYEMRGSLRDAYIKAADSIGTEYDRNRTLAAITKREMM